MFEKAAANIKTYFTAETGLGCVLVEKEHGPDEYLDDLRGDIFRRFTEAVL